MTTGSAPRPATATVSWALGFLIFIPIPFLGALVAGIAMATPYGTFSRRKGLARENARSAANWGISFALATVVLVALHFILLIVLSAKGPIEGFYPFGTVITIWLALCVLHVVLTITGTVRASQGKVMRVPFAIPFIRR